MTGNLAPELCLRPTWGAVRGARGPLIQKGVNDTFSLDQESPKYLCSESVEALASAGHCEQSPGAGKVTDGKMIKGGPVEGGEQRSLSFLRNIKGFH